MIPYNHMKVRVRLGAVCENYRQMTARAGNTCAVVKSDAYGHGLAEVTEALTGCGAKSLAVGTVEEAETVLKTSFKGDILSLLGPQLPEEYSFAAEHGIVCFCGRREQLERLSEAGKKAGRRVPVALKFDTGMRRLGFVPEEASRLAEQIVGFDGIEPVMAASHLAVADDPDREDFVRLQAERFEKAVAALRDAGLPVRATLANSAALLAFPEYHYNMQRPGISLYGGNPFWGNEREELGRCVRPAMDVSTRVYQVHDLAAGEGIHYGLSYTADRDMRVAIVGAGYADNYSRGLSNKGFMVLHGVRVPVVGRVCMQMTAVDVTNVPEVRAGDVAWVLGGPSENAVTPDELADWWGTISYEVLCLLGMNPREYA